MATVSNVSTAKPKVGGALSVGAKGSTLPTDASSTLATAYKSLGYISEDGLTNTNSPESESIKAWGGDVVATPMTGKEDTFTFSLIEVLNVDVLKYVYGDDNVTGDIDTGITVKAKADEPEEHVLVFDMILRGALKRIVVPHGTITEIGEIGYKDSEAAGYEVTVSAAPDADGVTHYEYVKSSTAKG